VLRAVKASPPTSGDISGGGTTQRLRLFHARGTGGRVQHKIFLLVGARGLRETTGTQLTAVSEAAILLLAFVTAAARRFPAETAGSEAAGGV
jgi:hypothetical protein